MDPRHPEQAVERMDQLMNQFKMSLDALRKETVAPKLAEAERQGSLVVQEICLVAPRLHEAMMQISRQRRLDLTRQILIPSTDEETKKSLEFFKEVEKEESKPKKKAAKKKTTKKKAE